MKTEVFVSICMYYYGVAYRVNFGEDCNSAPESGFIVKTLHVMHGRSSSALTSSSMIYGDYYGSLMCVTAPFPHNDTVENYDHSSECGSYLILCMPITGYLVRP